MQQSTRTQSLIIRGAREHNLKNIDLELPKRKLIVFTGPSGSGKSSLAFDTLYAEGRRRYVESLSTYARQFLGQIEKPDFDELLGLSPTISIEQKTTGNNPRSTVGTITEIHDHLRILYAQLGEQTCHQCGGKVAAMSLEAIVNDVLRLEQGTRFMVLAPLVQNRKGEYRDMFEKLRKNGFARARIDGEFVELEQVDKLDRHKRHYIDVVVDRLVAKPSAEQRIADSVKTALIQGEGKCIIYLAAVGDAEPQERLYSRSRSCGSCNIAFPEVTHQSFSFNSPLGMCTHCRGIGTTMQVEPSLLIIDESLSIEDGAIVALGSHPDSEKGKKFRWQKEVKALWRKLITFASESTISIDKPWKDLNSLQQHHILYGSGNRKATAKFDGLIALIENASAKAHSAGAKAFFEEFMQPAACTVCNGYRLRPESRAVKFRDISLVDLEHWSITKTLAFCEGITLNDREALIAQELLHETILRLYFLKNVGLEYLTLDRAASTLSGGESQRIRLASQLGSELSGILYVLDEPSIGLHQRDHVKLIETLQGLRDRGNSVIVVEHDRDTMEMADFVVDFGPGAGKDGGQVVVCGTPQEVAAHADSVTGNYLAGRQTIGLPQCRRTGDKPFIIRGARENNLKNIDITIPTRTFTCVTGVSGAGKSTLINDILVPAVARHVNFKHRSVGEHDSIEGLELFDKVIEIDQSPIGRTPRSNPATYTKVFDHIRAFFAALPDAKMYGFDPGRFSFNVVGGRCEECKGAGVAKVEMSFLADVYVPCNACLGKRFNAPTLRVKYRNHSIADVLDLTVAEAAQLFEHHPKIARVLQTLLDVGMHYMKIGQSSPTLSGGEAQRIKLSRELAKLATGNTLYILDEPSTGLHFDDIRKLLKVIDQLVDAGNTVVMIEHNLDIIAYADYLIDLGPEGGEYGGQIIACGAPEDVAAHPQSHTGRFLKPILSAAS